MAKLRYSFDEGQSWRQLEGETPLTIKSSLSHEPWVEPRGPVITSASPVAAFFDNFEGPSAQFLEERYGWTQIAGPAGALRLNASGTAIVRRGSGGVYLSPNLNTVNVGVNIKHLTRDSPGAVLLKYLDNGNRVEFTRNGSSAGVVTYKDGAYHSQSFYAFDPDLAPTDTVNIEIIGNNITLKLNGVPHGSVYTLPAGIMPVGNTRQGFLSGSDRINIDWIGEYETYAL